MKHPGSQYGRRKRNSRQDSKKSSPTFPWANSRSRYANRVSTDGRGDVDAITKNVFAVDNHITEIDPDPQFESALGWNGVIDGTRCPLHLDGTAERVDDTRKIREDAVACRADDPPAMRSDQRVDGAAELAQRLVRPHLILAHQPAEPDHVSMQDGGELPLPGKRFP